MNAFVRRWWDALSPADLQVYISGSPTQAAEVVRVHAQRGELEAQAQLGQMLLDGHGMQQDPVEALHWFRTAAERGHAMARNMLGRCFQLGWGCERDMDEASDHYRIAAAQGLDWGMYNYAMLLTGGLRRGAQPDLPKAFDLFQRAADSGHAKSMNLVGRFYEDGIVVDADPVQARHWYQRSAEGGDFRGQYSLGGMLLAEGDLPAALEWLTRSLNGANLKFLRARRADLLQWPHPDVRLIALGFYRRAAELGDAEDQAQHRQVSQPVSTAHSPD
jgi:TPR repeat protein